MIAIAPTTFKGYSYEETASYPYYGPAERASNPHQCISPDVDDVYCTTSISYSLTKSETYSANVDITWKKYVKTGASFSWNTSASVSSTYSVRHPENTQAWIEFKPRYNVTIGKLVTTTYTEFFEVLYEEREDADGYSPSKLSNGQLQGIVKSYVTDL
ncbi:hypothetical protein [Chengkuizengella sediminis]|uniref:hypothetical protein n=1 Tax=Chengkuizengella sediminis TaxID=1885917 RepID=UPI00138973E1|nr:hypothetical protein [Chengkuizengella sediminis]NDI37129.1 hypothetical protein [Chengkuizengella sediminis]